MDDDLRAGGLSLRHNLTYGVILATVTMFAASIGAGVRADVNSPVPTLATALAGPQRSAKFVARDLARHPAETLAFFGLRPDMSVVEMWPGGGYWTEILAPFLRPQGRYEIVLPPPKDVSVSFVTTPIGRKIAIAPEIYDRLTVGIAGKDHFDIAPPDSVDLVVSFRNLHNWMADGYAPEMFTAIFKALKSGGIFGIEEHRGHRDGTQDPRAADGYVREDAVIAFATAAGFVLEATSEVNANPKDSANWPRGVWTLPPDLALGDTDRAKYVAIGEADNAVLRFRKP